MGKFRGEHEIFSRKRGGNVKVYFQNEGERDFFLNDGTEKKIREKSGEKKERRKLLKAKYLFTTK